MKLKNLEQFVSLSDKELQNTTGGYTWHPFFRGLIDGLRGPKNKRF